MPEKKEAPVAEEFDPKKYWLEKVDFYAFKDNGRYKDDIHVGYNGKMYVIQRGKHVMIPRAVAEIIYQSMEQDQRTAELIEEKSAYFQRESQKYR